jgi:hypothetical protein
MLYAYSTSLCHTSLTKSIHGPYFAPTQLLPKRWLFSRTDTACTTLLWKSSPITPSATTYQHTAQATLATTRTPGRPKLQGLYSHAVLHFYTVNMSPDVQDSICIKRPGSISPRSSNPPAAHFASGCLLASLTLTVPKHGSNLNDGRNVQLPVFTVHKPDDHCSGCTKTIC